MKSLRDILPDLLKTNSKAGLAKPLGVSRPTLDRYIREPDTMTVKTLKLLAKIDGYSIWLEPKKQKYTL